MTAGKRGIARVDGETRFHSVRRARNESLSRNAMSPSPGTRGNP